MVIKVVIGALAILLGALTIYSVFLLPTVLAVATALTGSLTVIAGATSINSAIAKEGA